MELPISKIELACAKKDARKYLEVPYIDASDPENPVMVASTGTILAVAPVTLDDDDVGGYLPHDAIKAARKTIMAPVVKANGTVSVPVTGASYPRPFPDEPQAPRYPDYRRVMPDAGSHTVTLGIDAELLMTLAKAISANGKFKPYMVALKFAPNADGIVDGPISVSAKGSDAVGVIMPCRP